MSSYIPNNEHFLKRARNIRNELLNRTDRYFLIDYPIYDIELVFVELPKFHKEVNGLETLSDKWLYFLKYARQLDVVPESMNLVPEIKQAFEMANEMNLTPEQVAQFTSEEFVNAVESVFCHS